MKVSLSPDEKCENKIREFNEIYLASLPFSEQIQCLCNLLFSLHKYQIQDSKLAAEQLPVVQNNLGVVLVHSTQNLPGKEIIDRLKESIRLFAISASAGNQGAKENLPIVQNKLARALRMQRNNHK